MKTKSCKTCSIRNSCPYLRNFYIDENTGCVDWQDTEFHNTTLSDNIGVQNEK